MKEVTFYVTRHGETIFNILGKIQGWSDTPLTQQGIRSAELLGKGIKNTKFVAAYSSDSGRAIETAKIILKESGQEQIDLYQDKRLREWGFGSLEGESNQIVMDIILKALKKKVSLENLTYYLPQVAESIAASDNLKLAESFHLIKRRLKAVFQDMAEAVSAKDGGNVLVVSHAFTIKTLIYLLSNRRLNEAGKIENGSITKIIFTNEQFHVSSINDISYINYAKKQ